MPKFLPAVPILVAIAAAFAFGADAKPKPDPFTLASPDFADGGNLPITFTCDGDRASPSLKWNAPPAGTKTLAIVMHTIPAPGDEHVYLLLYNIPPDVTSLPKNARDVGTFGLNTVNEKPEYTPPCSKGPGPKKYTLTIYALADQLKFDKLVTRTMLLAAIKDITLASSEMNVTYSRAANADPDNPDPPAHPHPGGPPELHHALSSLTLTADQKTKVADAVEKFHKQQEQARNNLLEQLKEILDARQFDIVKSSFIQPPPPPPDANH